MSLSHPFAIFSLVCYLSAAGTQGLYWTGRTPPRWFWFCFTFFAILIHGYLLYQWIDVSRGQNLTVVNVFSLITWVVSSFLFLAAFYKPVINLSILIFPITALSILFATFLPGQHIEKTGLNPKAFLHIWLAVLAFSFLTIAAGQALFLAFQERLLRMKRLSFLLQNTAPLETMETVLFQMILFGFMILSVMLISSLFFFDHIFKLPLLQQTLLTFLAWFVFAVLLWGRYFFGWRGQVAVRWTLSGFVLLFLAYFGSAWMIKMFY